MKPLTLEAFQAWMKSYGKASRENDARASADLFSLDAKYYETPFAEPIIGRQAIFQYWNDGAQKLRDKQSIFEILAVNDNLGIAHWQSKFTAIESEKRFVLDCLFIVDFDDEGLCRTFREWWHIQDAKTS